MEEVNVLSMPSIMIEQAAGDDGPTPLLSPLSASSPKPVIDPPAAEEQYICYTCRRKLGSQEMLEKHEKFSQLHEKNLRVLKQSAQRKRAEIRDDIVRLRSTLISPSADDAYLRKQEVDLGLCQEEFEQKNNSHIEGSEIVNMGRDFTLEISGQSWTGNKATNEDRMILSFPILSDSVKGCLIADGHCGAVCADYLMDHFPDTLARELRKVLPEEGRVGGSQIKQALIQAFRSTDSEFLSLAGFNQIPSGSTAIVVVFFLNESGQLSCITAHVGDSRALLMDPPASGKNEKVTRLTSDHKPDRDDEKQRLQSSGGHVIDVGGIWRVFTPNLVCIGGRTLQWGLAVSRAFGDLALKKPNEIVSAEPEISQEHLLQNGSLLVLACDGIFDVLTDQDTVKAALEQGPSGVLRTAYGKLSDDNLTAIVIKVSSKLSTHPVKTMRPRAASIISSPVKKRKKDDSAAELITPSQLI